MEDDNSVAASGVTTPGGSHASDTVSEIAASMSQGMANAARSAMEKVAARSKVAPLKELLGIQPSVFKRISRSSGIRSFSRGVGLPPSWSVS